MARATASVILAAAAFLLVACAATHQPAGLQKIVISYPTKTGQVWPLYMAKEGGYYEKYGLDVDLVFGTSPTGIAMVSAEQAAMTPYTLEQSMLAAMRDESLVAIGSPFKKSLFALMAAKNITDIKQLKGKRIAVTQLADAPHNYTIGLLARAGLSPRDVQWVPVGGGVTARAAALAANRVDATMITAPNYFPMEKEGFNNLANISDYEEIYAPSVYLFKRSVIEKDPSLAERLLKAHAEGIKRFYDDKEFAVQAYLKWDPQDPADQSKVYDHYRRTNTYERVPYILKPAVDYILAHPADDQTAEKMRAFDFRRVLDNRFVDKLVEEGFFEKLFGESIRAEIEMKRALAFR